MKNILALLLISGVIGCAHTPTPSRVASAEPFELRVSLYPWIPDRDAFAKWIEAEFEKRNSDIDLVVRPMGIAVAENDAIDLSYDLGYAKSALLSKDSVDFQHMVEIDTMILGSLVRAKAVKPVSLTRNDHFEFAKKAVTVDQLVYGIPHWTCGYFLMTTHSSVAKAGNAVSLQKSLADLGTAQADIGGKIGGSWGSIVAYLDAYLDTFPTANARDALLHTAPDPSVLPYLKAFGEVCTGEGEAGCNVYGKKDVQFARGSLDALVGYSERLNAVMRDENNQVKAEDVYITPAPIGGGKSNFLFTDALVTSATCNDERCMNATRRFADFYVSDRIFQSAMLSLDGSAESSVPRYLLPSTVGAVSTPRVSSDPIYSQLTGLMGMASPYPNQGVPEARNSGVIRKFVDELLHTPSTP